MACIENDPFVTVAESDQINPFVLPWGMSPAWITFPLSASKPAPFNVKLHRPSHGRVIELPVLEVELALLVDPPLLELDVDPAAELELEVLLEVVVVVVKPPPPVPVPLALDVPGAPPLPSFC
jgi:hypothetical protein